MTDHQFDGSLKITGRMLRIAVNDDPDRVISFDPADAMFAERFYSIYREFDGKRAELERRSVELDEGSTQLDENGIPTNVSEGLAFIREICDFMRNRIDYVFGAGTSQKAFGDSYNIESIVQFFDGMTPFVQKARSEKLLKYQVPVRRKRRAK